MPNDVKKKTILIYSPSRLQGEVWLPALWSQAKTYYEKHGKKQHEWTWYPCYADVCADDIDRVKTIIESAQPDIFAISLYLWSADTAHIIAQWVKHQFPKCLIVSGGPHQYFQHDSAWFHKHPYIDCSLPGDRYGELCFAELLDNFSDRIDFNQISDLRFPVGKERMIVQSKKTLGDRRLFDYDWCSFAEQHPAMLDYIAFARQLCTITHIGGILETTRGCPYGCTYCDWGGGINTLVIKKSLDTIKKDLDCLISLDLNVIFLADANFGIFGERDIDVMRSIIDCRKKYQSDIGIVYGGFAKTENRLDALKEIIKLDIDNNLNVMGHKISLQTLDHDVLRNMDRKNIPLDQQLELYRSVMKSKIHARPFVEMILGLPGMTLDKFYHEITILGKNNLGVLWYEWVLLPETPAYSPQYRDRFGIKTVSKYQGWYYSESGSQREIVVGGKDFTTDDYLQMTIAIGCYRAIVQGGFYKNCLRYQSIDLGLWIKDIVAWYLELYPDIRNKWREIMDDHKTLCQGRIKDIEVPLDMHFVASVYLNPDGFLDKFDRFIRDRHIPRPIIWYDRFAHLTRSRSDFSWNDIEIKLRHFEDNGRILRRLGGLL